MNGNNMARNERVSAKGKSNPCWVCQPRKGCNQFGHRYPKHGTKHGKGSK